MDAPQRQRTDITRVVILIAALALVATLYLARSVLIPLALALLLTFLLTPLVMRLQRARVPRALAVVLVVAAALSVVSGLGWLVGRQAADLAGKIPQYRQNVLAKAQALRGSLGVIGQASQAVHEFRQQIATQPAGQAADEGGDGPAATAPASAPAAAGAPGQKEPIDVRVVSDQSGIVQMLLSFLGPLLHPLATGGIVLFFLFFMLLRRDDLRDRIIRLIGSGQVNVTTEAMDEAARRVSRYLIALVLVNGINGTAFGLGLALIGLPNALLWGLLAAVLRFIPYVGPVITAAMSFTLSLAIFNDWTRPLLVIGLYLLIELLCANVLEPFLYGNQTGASPLAIIISAVFWAWLWGPVGLVLATPLTVCLVVAGKYVPQLEFLSILLGDEPVLPPDMRLYQRLLALDDVEAAEILSESQKSMSLVEVYDRVLVPALQRYESDRHSGLVDQRRCEFIEQTVREVVQNLPERAAESEPAVSEPPPARDRRASAVLCIPARDRADELVAGMLTQLLELQGVPATTIGADLLTAELVESVQPDVTRAVCISALPPSTSLHTRYLVKRLCDQYPRISLVVGLWAAAIDKPRAVRRLGCETVEVVTTLAEALALLTQRVRVAAHQEAAGGPSPVA